MVSQYRLTATDIFEDMAADLGDLQRHWEPVVENSSTFGSRSGGWDVRKENRGNRLGPPFDQVAIYVEKGYHKREVGRWELDDLPDDPTEEVQKYLEGGING